MLSFSSSLPLFEETIKRANPVFKEGSHELVCASITYNFKGSLQMPLAVVSGGAL